MTGRFKAYIQTLAGSSRGQRYGVILRHLLELDRVLMQDLTRTGKITNKLAEEEALAHNEDKINQAFREFSMDAKKTIPQNLRDFEHDLDDFIMYLVRMTAGFAKAVADDIETDQHLQSSLPAVRQHLQHFMSFLNEISQTAHQVDSLTSRVEGELSFQNSVLRDFRRNLLLFLTDNKQVKHAKHEMDQAIENKVLNKFEDSQETLEGRYAEMIECFKHIIRDGMAFIHIALHAIEKLVNKEGEVFDFFHHSHPKFLSKIGPDTKWAQAKYEEIMAHVRSEIPSIAAAPEAGRAAA